MASETKSEPEYKWTRKFMLVRDLLGEDGGVRLIDSKVKLCGTVHSIKKLQPAFIHLVDGSTPYHVQLTIPEEIDVKSITKDTTIACEGVVVKSPKKFQFIEVIVSKLTAYGTCEGLSYKLAGYKQTRETLLSVPHLRSRHRYLSTIFKVRDMLSQAVHKFFSEREFMYVHTPILTAGDCEGAGEMFTVTTQDLGKKIDSKKPFKKDFFGKKVGLTVSGQLQVESYAKSHQAVYTFGPTFRAENSHTSRHLAEFWMIEPEMVTDSFSDLMDLAEDFVKYCIRSIFKSPQLKFLHEKSIGLLDKKPVKITYSDAVTLLVKSKEKFEVDVERGIELTPEHEKWLAKHFDGPVIVHEKSTVLWDKEDITLEKPFVRITYSDAVTLLVDSKEEFEVAVEWGIELESEHEKWLTKHFDGPVIVHDKSTVLLDKLRLTLEKPFVRITYTDAVTLLVESKEEFEVAVEWGVELESEHEKWLTKHFDGPVIVHDYPKSFKAFYMKQNDDKKTVQSMDLLVPGIGELIGGSMREDKLDVLKERMEEFSIEDLDWYTELRKYGTFPHGGFGLGFERLIMYVTGADNIRDVIPFPRYPRHADT